jgi:GDP/UDP-N,N'-diacetylbacillosamine 2-epimerase (hydrolysing)
MRELLGALAEIKDTGIIFTFPNSDTEGRALIREIENFCSKYPNAKSYPSLGQQLYLSCIKHVDGVIGNSSSGLMEVPSFKKGTVNIGDRQRGRLKAASVIDCDPNKMAIQASIEQLFSSKFQQSLGAAINPYGSGGASEKILSILETSLFDDLLKKRFHDIPN